MSAASAYAMIWYHRFYHHVTVEELSHEVVHSTFPATIRGRSSVVLQLYQQQNARDQQLVFFTSGDGGWSPFCADIAAHLAATGKTVVGFNVKDYLVSFASSQRPVSPEEVGRDYYDMINLAAARPGVATATTPILAGWSLGAGYSVLVATDAMLKTRIDRVVAISLPIYNELAWKPTDSLIYITHGTPREKVFDARQLVSKLDPVPIVIFNATDDDTSPYPESQKLFEATVGPKHLYLVNASGHHFEGGEAEFYRDLDEAISFDHP
ncbi:MAG TPA: AcvB/VirJ family lysyl-phosphatidylglycerol hydrolase [Pyrinomonadaceae bacterium]